MFRSTTNNMSLRIAGVEHCSSVDWYGKLATVFFCAGCNFSCGYCQNHKLINPREGEEMTLDDMREILDYNEPLIDAVVFTGGEPTLQENLYDFCLMIRKEYEFPIMIDTNGSNAHLLRRMIKKGLVDRLALDVKTLLSPYEYSRVIGVPSGQHVLNIFHVLKLVKSYDVEVEARTTVIPNLTDNPMLIDKLAHKIRYYVTDYHLQQCNTKNTLDPKLKEHPPPGRPTMLFLAHTAKRAGVESVYIKTMEKGIEKVF